jgi:hypothetical protein
MDYVPFQRTVTGERGVFRPMNGLAKEGRLSAEQERFRRTNKRLVRHGPHQPSLPTAISRLESTGPGKVIYEYDHHVVVARIDDFPNQFFHDNDPPSLDRNTHGPWSARKSIGFPGGLVEVQAVALQQIRRVIPFFVSSAAVIE